MHDPRCADGSGQSGGRASDRRTAASLPFGPVRDLEAAEAGERDLFSAAGGGDDGAEALSSSFLVGLLETPCSVATRSMSSLAQGELPPSRRAGYARNCDVGLAAEQRREGPAASMAALP
jgi:hypothetical protein